MDNPGITHNTKLDGYSRSVQAYVETGWIHLDLQGIGDGHDTIQLADQDAERLIRILSAALADKEA